MRLKARTRDAGVARDDRLVRRAHPDRIGPQPAEHPHLGARLVRRPGEHDVHPLAQRHAGPLRPPRAPRRAAAGRRHRSAAGKRGPKRSRFGPSSGLSPDRLRWSVMSITSPGSKSGFSPPAALVRTSVPRPERQDGAQQERRLAMRVALVRMGAAGAARSPARRGSCRPRSSPAWPSTDGARNVRDLAVRDGDARGRVEQLDDARPGPEPRTRHELRLGEGRRVRGQARTDGVGRLGDAPIELRAVDPVGEIRQGGLPHLHPLQEVALLGLVLLGRDRAPCRAGRRAARAWRRAHRPATVRRRGGGRCRRRAAARAGAAPRSSSRPRRDRSRRAAASARRAASAAPRRRAGSAAARGRGSPASASGRTSPS